MKKFFLASFILLSLASLAVAQIPTATLVQIVNAEDARRYDKTLEDLLKHPNEQVRIRAALAAGRIGNEAAILPLTALLEKEQSEEVRAMAAFALGETESIKAADAILKALGSQAETRAVASVSGLGDKNTLPTGRVSARLVEAAGKIVAANAKDEKAKLLGEAILVVLTAEEKKHSAPSVDLIRFGLTAVLRAKPAGAEETVRKFLSFTDPNIVADALNTLARLKAKNANRDARDLLQTHVQSVVRANAAPVLGAAEDKEAVDILIKAATSDTDSRVRVSAIRSLGNLKDANAADKLLERGEKLLADHKKSKYKNPIEKNELLEVVTALGRILENSNIVRAVKFLDALRNADALRSSETEIAFARISPKLYLDRNTEFITSYKGTDWRAASAAYQAMSVLAGLESNESNKKVAREAGFRLHKFAEGWFWATEKSRGNYKLAVPDLLRALVASKSKNLSGHFGPLLDRERDPFIRATAAELLADQPKSKENIELLIVAFAKSLETDKNENDAQIAILDALYKLDKKEAVGSLLRALNAPDYLVRKKAFELLADDDLKKEFPEIVTALTLARRNGMSELLPHNSEVMQVMSKSGTKLGQVLNTNTDYRRAVSRKNAKAILTTEKGTFTIDLLPEDAPLTVDNFIKLARSGYFNGVEVHRVVPNFVMQDGDPRGDGNGGPGWSIRCEINMLPYERGAVGTALSGKDTGGSQWFVTHAPQPHLDGGYTVFGRVNETDMKVVDNIVRGDKILNVKIIEPQRRRGAEKRNTNNSRRLHVSAVKKFL